MGRDELGNATIRRHDEANRAWQVENADGTTRTSKLNAFGQEYRSIDPNGTILDYARDRAGRTRERTLVFAAPGVDASVKRDLFEYDGAGQMLASERRSTAGAILPGTVRRHVDSRGLVVSETIDGRTVSASHDAAGNRTTLEYPSGRQVSRRLDALNRMVDLVEGPDPAGVGPCDGATSDPACLLHQLFLGPHVQARTFANGVRRVIGYNLDFLPALDKHLAPDGATLGLLNYSYDERHELTTRASSTGLIPLRSYKHDSIGRLTSSDALDASGRHDVVDYTLDGANNRLSVTGGRDPGTYVMTGADAQLNQYTDTPLGARTHDLNGNQLTAELPGGVTRTFTWDALNVLVAITDTGSPRSSAGGVTTRSDGASACA